MRALDIILKKRNGDRLSHEEIRFLIRGYVDGTIPEYQVSAFLMAVFFQGMNGTETGYLTREMIASGDTIDLSSLTGPFVDKHSTGGVGDKVSLILAPIAAACGVSIPMRSGRSLGHTGGTLDKLESIPGFSTALTPQRFAHIIGECGFSMTGQSESVVPADRKLYALRDVTGTVENVSLITGSILSKKFAEGADSLVFDVKTGAGAFMKTHEDARALAESLVETGKSLGKRIIAVLTRMDVPLGAKVGNFLEVEESLALLRCPAALEKTPVDGRSDDLMEVTLRLSGWMVVAAGIESNVDAGIRRCREVIEDGSAWERMRRNIELQGGDIAAMEASLGTMRAGETAEILAGESGYIAEMDAFAVGMASVYLGAGRSTATDAVYPDVGLEIFAKPGTAVRKGDAVARMWGHSAEALARAGEVFLSGVRISGTAPGAAPSMIIEELSSL